MVRGALALVLLAAPLVAIVPAVHAAQDDAGTGGDAGGSFAEATLVAPVGRHFGGLSGDDQDWYRFPVAFGQQLDIDIQANFITGVFPATDLDRRLGVTLYDPNGILLDSPNSNLGDSRVTLPRALVAGEYRLAFDAEYLGAIGYSFCFVITGDTCATVGVRPIQTGTPLPGTHAEVLLVPPTAIDPFALNLPTDYLAAALDGINEWDRALVAFGAKYPQYAYLGELDAHVEIFEGAPQRVGYDVIIVWSPYTGPFFRGLASDTFGGGWFCGTLCQSPSMMEFYNEQLEPVVHQGTRLIIMSSFAAAPRAGQVIPDIPEPDDVYNVMMHEFAHTWGLGHTQTWTAGVGPDLMNSPYSHVFGDGDLLGDGGERTGRECISSLDLYGMARMYEWVGRGAPWNERIRASSASLTSIPYEEFCPAA